MKIVNEYLMMLFLFFGSLATGRTSFQSISQDSVRLVLTALSDLSVVATIMGIVLVIYQVRFKSRVDNISTVNR